jgi:FixJ family two-component response regulator
MGDPEMTSVSECVVAVVDDDTRVLESLENLLESAGHTVHLFTSAQALLDNEAFEKIDCVISDIVMPTIDGFELKRLARVARPELAVVLITGRRELVKGRQITGRDDTKILLKPFGEQELLSAISNALASRTPR